MSTAPVLVSEPELPQPPAELLEVVVSSGLTGDSALAIQAAYTPFFLQVAEWKTKVATVTDPKIARESRLMLRRIRIEASHKHDEVKADALKFGRAVDSAFNAIETAIKPMETALEDIEKAAEREAAAKKAKLIQDRTTALVQVGADPSFFALGDMPDEHFARILADAKVVAEAKAAEERRKAEQARIEAEKAEADRKKHEAEQAAEQQRVRAENDRLRREKEEADRRAAEELDRRRKLHAARVNSLLPFWTARELAAVVPLQFADATDEQFAAVVENAKAQHEERERIAREKREAEERARRERQAAEAKALAEKEAAERAAVAPDRDKLHAFGVALAAMKVPQLATEKGKDAQAIVEECLRDLVDLVNAKAAHL